LSTHLDTVREKYLAYTAAHRLDGDRHAGYRNELKYIRRVKPLSADLRFLDVGCGPGTFTEFMVDQGVDSAGLDIDLSLVSAANARVRARGFHARFLVGRVEHLPYRNDVFDLCVANSLLEHAPDWEVSLREIARVLRPGGLLVFYTTNRLHPFQQEINGFPFYPWLPAWAKKPILAAIMKHRPGMVNYTDLPAINWFTFEQFKTFLRPLGFRVSTRLDLIQASDLHGWKSIARPLLKLIQRVAVARYLYYFYSRDTSVYAVKNSSL
jgi:SAM-dependent methyltransferase